MPCDACSVICAPLSKDGPSRGLLAFDGELTALQAPERRRRTAPDACIGAATVVLGGCAGPELEPGEALPCRGLRQGEPFSYSGVQASR